MRGFGARGGLKNGGRRRPIVIALGLLRGFTGPITFSASEEEEEEEEKSQIKLIRDEIISTSGSGWQ